MTRIILSLMCLILGVSASAQKPEDLIAELRKAAADAHVVVEYSFSAFDGGVIVEDSGVVEAQDGMWVLKGRRIEIHTADGVTWILDKDSKEAVVEPAWTYDDLVNFHNSAISSGHAPEIKVHKMTSLPLKETSYFIPALGSDWVVTDLR